MTSLSDQALRRLQRGFGEPDLAGTRYELIALLGRGGMGDVYLARDTVLDREVALKVVAAPGLSDRSRIARALEREASILARLEHPGIVPVHDFGELPDGRLFYAMKRVRGERLDRWAARASIPERLAVFLRICDAVAFAHARGIVHRDLKPENVMIGEFGEVLVLDWGAARIATSLESAEAVAGTPDFMAPEQEGNAATVDGRADVYSLGVMLAALSPGSKAMEAIAAKARSAQPDARYQTAQALAADVSRFLSGLAVEALREDFVDRLLRLARRYRLPLSLVLTYLAMRLLLLWLFKI